MVFLYSNKNHPKTPPNEICGEPRMGQNENKNLKSEKQFKKRKKKVLNLFSFYVGKAISLYYMLQDEEHPFEEEAQKRPT